MFNFSYTGNKLHSNITQHFQDHMVSVLYTTRSHELIHLTRHT